RVILARFRAAASSKLSYFSHRCQPQAITQTNYQRSPTYSAPTPDLMALASLWAPRPTPSWTMSSFCSTRHIGLYRCVSRNQVSRLIPVKERERGSSCNTASARNGQSTAGSSPSIATNSRRGSTSSISITPSITAPGIIEFFCALSTQFGGGYAPSATYRFAARSLG